MTAATDTTVSETAPERRRAPRIAVPAYARRVPFAAWLWFGTFGLLSAILVVRNRYLFHTRIYETNDYAANSVAILQAKHLTLLTGQYSRMRFFHPGPFFLYIQAAGEVLFRSVLHLVPTPWNGQLIAQLLLNAALTATIVLVLHRNLRSRALTLACLGTLLAVYSVHPLLVNSEWMPYAYFCPLLLMLVTAATVAAGNHRDLPFLAAGAAMCVNGQALFLLFAPVIVLAALAVPGIRHRHELRAALRATRSSWLPALAVALVLLFPTILNTLIHWPGEFGRYYTYATSGQRHHRNPLPGSISYVLHFWWPDPRTRAVVAIALSALATALAVGCPRPHVRRLLVCAVGVSALMTLLFLYYTVDSVDGLDQTYEGYFYWTVPALILLVIVVGAGTHLADRPALRLGLGIGVVASALTAALVIQTADNPTDPQPVYTGAGPALPAAVAALEARSQGRPIVLTMDHDAWSDALAVVAYADRHSITTCLGNARWEFLARSQSICTARERDTGVVFWLHADDTGPVKGTVIASLQLSKITQGTAGPM